ncbi:MAG TPA: hypothetical protein VHC68_03325 [Candidatus Paceibacterota bacterium]|nr:hypothetical protein [Candidatus Paceibacterota bacterium]
MNLFKKQQPMERRYTEEEGKTGFVVAYQENAQGSSVTLEGAAAPLKTSFAPGREDSARILYQEALEMLKARAERGMDHAAIERDLRELIEGARED